MLASLCMQLKIKLAYCYLSASVPSLAGPRTNLTPKLWRRLNSPKLSLFAKALRSSYTRHHRKMSSTLPLLRGQITLDDALDEDDNMLPPLGYYKQRLEFLIILWENRAAIESIVSFHMGRDQCELSDIDKWMGGSFNICIPIYVGSSKKLRSSLGFHCSIA